MKMMRALATIAVLGMAEPAHADFSPAEKLLREFSVIHSEIQTIMLCKLRDENWFVRVANQNLQAMMTVASRNPGVFLKTASQPQSFAVGATVAATAIAAADFRRRGQVVCEELVQSGRLDVLDGLLK